MQAFHNDIKIKQKYIERVDAHIKADNLIRGKGWENGKGCAVGCTLESYEHKQYETELGIPEWLARVEDTLFEGMNEEKSKTWPKVFLKVIPVGVDLEQVRVPFLLIVLEQNLNTLCSLGVGQEFKNVITCIEQTKTATIQVMEALKNGGDLLAAELAAELAARSAAWSAESAAESTAWLVELAAELAARSAESAARSARSAARSTEWSTAWSVELAAELAARSAARSTAWLVESAARSAAWSAELAAESAAWSAESAARSTEWLAELAARSAAWSAAWLVARSAAFDYYADELIELLKNAAIGKVGADAK